MKRDLFTELKDGFDELAQHREGKITLKNHQVKARIPQQLTATELKSLRESLNLSRAVMARYLMVNERTLESWEQGRTQPNSQAATLIQLVKKYPDTLEKLASL